LFLWVINHNLLLNVYTYDIDYFMKIQFSHISNQLILRLILLSV
jgi:hypothetical protein